MEAEESNTSTCISEVLNSLLICRLCCKSFWNIIDNNNKLHEDELTVGSYLPLSSNGSSILVEVAETLTICRHFRSQNSEARHTVWSQLQFRQSKLPLEGCYFAKRFTKENRCLQVGVQFSVLSDVSANRKSYHHSWLQSGWTDFPCISRTSSISDFKTYTRFSIWHRPSQRRKHLRIQITYQSKLFKSGHDSFKFKKLTNLLIPYI
jgi:hypothetical protein